MYYIHEGFKSFVRKGEIGEMCRMYISVNPRSNQKTQNILKRGDHNQPLFNLCLIIPIIVHVTILIKINVHTTIEIPR